MADTSSGPSAQIPAQLETTAGIVDVKDPRVQTAAELGCFAEQLLDRGASRQGVSRLRLQRNQHVPGWCVLPLRRHVQEPHELLEPERIAFFEAL